MEAENFSRDIFREHFLLEEGRRRNRILCLRYQRRRNFKKEKVEILHRDLICHNYSINIYQVPWTCWT